MPISTHDISIKRRQAKVSELLLYKHWYEHQLGMFDSEYYGQRLAWLKEVLGQPIGEFEDLEQHEQYRWANAPLRSAMGLVDGMQLAFRIESDRTMFVLRWGQ